MMSQKENFFRFYLTEADPWYSGDFKTTWNDVVAGFEGFLQYLNENKTYFTVFLHENLIE